MRASVLMLLALTVASCNESVLDPSAQPLTVTRIATGTTSLTYNSSYTTTHRLVIRDAQTWQQTWAAIWTNLSPQPTLPAVDFSREIVVVAIMGQRPTGGFSIFVDDAVRDGDGARVRIRSVSPGPGCAVTLAMTQPADAARMTRVDGTVTFEESATAPPCG